jgi:hypothetical protein
LTRRRRALAVEFGEDLDGVGTPAGRLADVAVWRAAGPGAGTTRRPGGRSPWRVECLDHDLAAALTLYG